MLDDLVSSPVDLTDAVTAIGFSLAASVVVYLMYHLFYGSRQVGAGVQRAFIIGGPAITALFLGIQTSIPLSLGLLGALSFVRFRTPVKDPAEIGFLLLLIASSIGASTGNYVVTVVLFVLVFAALGVQRLVRDRFTLTGWGNLMISVDRDSFEGAEPRLAAFLEERVPGLKLVSASTLDDRVSLHYQYRRSRGFDWPTFFRDLERVAHPAKVETFLG